MTDNKGIFTLSLDTELAWGMFDKDNVGDYENAYRNTPDVVDHLCNMFDEYDISATWAIVSHLLMDCDKAHTDRTSPNFEWIDDWFAELPCVNGFDDVLWFAPWLIDRLQACETAQEIGLHGSTHMQLGADGCSRQHAEEEIDVAVKTLREHGLEPKSFVFPRNDVGHVDVLREHGIKVYRGRDAYWYERASVPNIIKPPCRFVDEAVRGTPPVTEPIEHNGILEIPGSQTFRPSHDGWQYTPGECSVERAKKGLERAARTGKTFHLWFHPFNLGHSPEKDCHRLERILMIVDELVREDLIKCVPMGEYSE
ncbi:polysaccharide deacetylase family protein [Halorubrum sp. CBA1229]|uniref:polysaccharide deacetylase family protein n=1 Tax=Halorubrum sp. CBA1229 TaxID=1853699 RepID=UPI000F3C5601|nr:polysaccharide deacetylase family protein [Halorubrum sp. CBA1229]QKY15579.1 polysaccharide deacetylase family protein [Halorubrum sp. CBA1229]